jgi:ferredoxin
MPGSIARIEVDRDACIGSGCCVGTAPGVFKLDNDGISTVINPEGASEATIQEAAEGCPATAISLYDAAGARLFP